MVYSSNSHICSLIIWHSFWYLLCNSPCSYWEKRESAIWVTPTAVVEGSWQVLESLSIWIAPSFLKAAWEVVAPVHLLLGAKHVPCSCLLYCQMLYHCFVPPRCPALPDCVNPVLKNTPALKALGTYTHAHPWAVLLYSLRMGKQAPVFRQG